MRIVCGSVRIDGRDIISKACPIKHVGLFPELEEQMCSYLRSPDRMDPLVWAISEFMDPEVITTQVVYFKHVNISPF
jgi:phage terminase large subunit-like protein